MAVAAFWAAGLGWVFYPGRADIANHFSWTLPEDTQVCSPSARSPRP